MGGANGVFPPAGQSTAQPGQSMGQLEAALNNLALAASTDSAILQQLTAANLALTTTNAMLTANNKTLVDLATKARAAANAGGTGGRTADTGRTTGGREKSKPIPNSYCWMHGHKVYGNHSSATCTTKAEGHQVEATHTNTLGGSERNKGWAAAST